jgi:hypothetical protein
MNADAHRQVVRCKVSSNPLAKALCEKQALSASKHWGSQGAHSTNLFVHIPTPSTVGATTCPPLRPAAAATALPWHSPVTPGLQPACPQRLLPGTRARGRVRMKQLQAGDAAWYSAALWSGVPVSHPNMRTHPYPLIFDMVPGQGA